MFKKEKKAWKAEYEKKIREVLADPTQTVDAISSRASVKIKGGQEIKESTNGKYQLLSANDLQELYHDLDAPHEGAHFEFSGTNKDRIQDTVAKHINTKGLEIPTSRRFLYDAAHWQAYSHVLLNKGLLTTQAEAIAQNPDKNEKIALEFQQFEAKLQKITANILRKELTNQQKLQNDTPEKPGFFGRIINAIQNTLTGLASAVKKLLGLGTPANQTTTPNEQTPVSRSTVPTNQSSASTLSQGTTIQSDLTSTLSASSTSEREPLNERKKVQEQFVKLGQQQEAALEAQSKSTIEKTPEATPEPEKPTLKTD